MLSLKVERKKKGGESGYMRKKRGKDGTLKAKKTNALLSTTSTTENGEKELNSYSEKATPDTAFLLEDAIFMGLRCIICCLLVSEFQTVLL